MDIIQLYSDYSVNFLTEGHKHCRPGWVNTACPYCTGNPGYHLGYEMDSDHFYCWRCGWHPTIPTLSLLLQIPNQEVYKVLRSYGLFISKPTKEPIVKIGIKPHRMPSGIGPLEKRHKEYLESRKFDPQYLEHLWHLVGTGPVSLLDGIDYKLRIIIPVIWDLAPATFTSRDITGKHPLRYRACPKERETIHHKHIVYGKQEAWKNTGIVVEGPTDVWRFGTAAVCTFGIEFTNEQIRVLAKNFKRLFVAFDDDPQAIVQANKLVSELRFREVEAFRIPIIGDPGSMPQDEADYLVKQLIK